jgi:hypothetical protein
VCALTVQLNQTLSAPMFRFVLAIVSSLVLLCSAYPNTAAAESKVGVASAIKNDVQGIVGGAARPLATGSDVYARERVRTGVDSTAQLLFLDQTSLSIGPSAEIGLDAYVLDSGRGGGNVVMSASRGAFRFVTGALNPRTYTIRTPVATIGVRGTIVDGYINPNAGPRQVKAVIILVEGAVHLTAKGGPFQLTKPGTAFVIYGDGSVHGPVTPDGSLTAVAGNVPFPLYGTNFWADPRRFVLPDSQLDLNDMLKGTGSPPGNTVITGPGN